MKKVAGIVSTNYGSYSFGALLDHRPVASLPFGGRYRLVDFPLSNLVNAGITTIGLITPYHFRSVLDHVGVGKEWNLARKSGGMFVLPGSVYGFKSLHGKLLLRDLVENRAYLDRTSDSTLVIAGASSVMNIDLRPVIESHFDSGAQITLIYRRGEGDSRTPGYRLTVGDDGRVVRISDTPGGADGIFLDHLIIEHETMVRLLDLYASAGYLDLLEVIRDNLSSLDVRGHVFEGYVRMINSLEDYVQCSHDLFSPVINDELFMGERPIYTKVQDNPPAKYLSGSVKNAIIATGCTIEGDVSDSILFRNVTVGKGAVIKNSIIYQRCIIEPGAQLENVICDKFAHIRAGVQLSGTAESPFVVAKYQVI